MKNKKIEGNIGEELATQYLISKGYKIICRNFIAKGGEIDIIATIDDTIVFVEVKNRNNNLFGESLESITPAKMKCIVKSAKQFVHSRKLYCRPMRFDIIAIDRENIEHITDAFWAN